MPLNRTTRRGSPWNICQPALAESEGDDRRPEMGRGTAPDAANARTEQGFAFFDRVVVELGVAAFRNALTMEPQYAEASISLAAVFLSAGRYAEGMEHCSGG